MRAVRLLASAGDLSVMPIVERLLYDERLEVRTEALLYLTQYATIDPLDRIDRLGEFADYSVRASAVAFLAHGARRFITPPDELLGCGNERDAEGRHWNKSSQLLHPRHSAAPSARWISAVPPARILQDDFSEPDVVVPSTQQGRYS